MNISQMVVTPRIANGWLETAKLNRKVSKKTVGRYAADMGKDQWAETGESIKFNGDGSLIDGQHRLLAIVSSGKSQKLVIVKGLDKGIFACLDTGKKRNLSDVLSIAGVDKYNSSVAALTRIWSAYKMFGLEDMFRGDGLGGLRPCLNNAEYLKFYSSHPEITENHSFVISLRKGTTSGRALFSSASLAFWFGLFRESDEGLAKEYISKLINGDALQQGDPVHRFREKAMGYKFNKVSLERKTLTILAVKSWNYWKSGDKPKSLTAHYKSKMPKVL